MRKLHVHETGGGPTPPTLTPVEEAVWRILGKTPGFIGVTDRKSDSKVVVRQSKNTNGLQGRICNATMCYIGIDLDLSKPKGMPLGLKLHTYSLTTKYINMAKA